jgi:hypothetical protein
MRKTPATQPITIPVKAPLVTAPAFKSDLVRFFGASEIGVTTRGGATGATAGTSAPVAH